MPGETVGCPDLVIAHEEQIRDALRGMELYADRDKPIDHEEVIIGGCDAIGSRIPIIIARRPDLEVPKLLPDISTENRRVFSLPHEAFPPTLTKMGSAIAVRIEPYSLGGIYHVDSMFYRIDPSADFAKGHVATWMNGELIPESANYRLRWEAEKVVLAVMFAGFYGTIRPETGPHQSHYHGLQIAIPLQS